MGYSLQEKYKKETVPALREKFGYKNMYTAPRILKIVINSGVGKMVNARNVGHETGRSEEDVIKDLMAEFMLFAGQKPQIIRAKKSISGFKLRKGTIAGVRATLRGKKMFDFLSRLVHIYLPRMRDFRGLEENSLDERGNLNVGIREQIIFPEIPHDKVRQMWGMVVTVVTTAKRREEGVELLRQLGLPFRRAINE